VSKLGAGARVGLSAYGNPENALGISVGDSQVALWRREKNQHQQIAVLNAPKTALLHLRLEARDGSRFRFAVSSDGKQWKEVGDAEGAYLPPWDLAVRVALTAGGNPGALGKFDYLRIEPAR
jgi:xylan 1,4-beta-xylosidase